MATRNQTQDQQNQNARKFDARALHVTIAPAFLMAAALQHMEQMFSDARYLTRNPGFIATAKLVGYTSQTIETAYQSIRGTDKGKRVDSAVNYMKEHGIGLTNVGQANGVPFNCAIAIARPEQLDPVQRKIFGGSEHEPLIDAQGLCDWINAAVQAQPFALDEQGQITKSPAELLRDAFANSAGVDDNVWSVLYSLGIDSGAVNPRTLVETVKALRVENAQVQNVPTPAITAAKRHFAQPQPAYQA